MKYSKDLERSIKESKEIAIIIRSNTIRPEHLFLALIDNSESKVYLLLYEMNLNIDAIKQTLKEWSVSFQSKIGFFDQKIEDTMKLDIETDKILKNAVLIAKNNGLDEIDSDHVFLSILENTNNLVTELFSKSPETYKNIKLRLNNQEPLIDIDEDLEQRPVSESISSKSSKTKVINQFGVDLTELARNGELDKVVGRQSEIKRISQILSRRKKNNPILIGEPGVGKSAIAEKLSQLIVEGKVSSNLKDKRIISIDMGALVAGTKYRGEFEQRLRGIVKEMEENRNIILFIDEIHTIIGAGSAQGSLDASNMLKPALSRGTFQCIGTTTLEEFRKYFEKDGALERRFQKVLVEPTTKEETLEILKNIKDKYEDYHLVRYTDEALQACVDLTDKYITEKFLPDKAIDAMDEAGSKVHVNKIVNIPKNIKDLETKIRKAKIQKEKLVNSQKFEMAANIRDMEREMIKELDVEKEKWNKEQSLNRETVSKDDIAEVVSLMTKIPIDNVSSDENKKLKEMSSKIKNIVIGQDEAIDKLVRSVKRSRIGIKDPKKPVGSFMFLGPTGIGKSFSAKVMAKELFGSENAMIRIDMSEYMEKHSVSRLIGAPPGYVGYDDGGQLTESVRRRPYSIILLDEIEKAHPDVQNILLQILDDGILTDSYGRKVDFKNTIIIMTSNAGSRKLKDFGVGIGFSSQSRNENLQKDKNDVIDKELKKIFSPEFLNRIDEIIMFNSLTKSDIGRIVDLEIKTTIQKLKEMGYYVNITQSLKDYIFEKGYDQNYGARPLKRAIQKYIEDRLTDAIINEEVKVGEKFSLKYDKNISEVKIVKYEKIKKISPKDPITN